MENEVRDLNAIEAGDLRLLPCSFGVLLQMEKLRRDPNLVSCQRRMGRVKLKIKRLESTSNTQVTFSKRRNGILKKTKELSILCDIDIVLMFSPTGRPSVFHGEHRSTSLNHPQLSSFCSILCFNAT